ncbi:hypothetical protein RHGRI_018298 [Rhododendron griersonianum]|uniref:Thioredoxin domain-containing protein n=1 Tax=Rhododendron griersonianum TaxID=479676 RepID=A0AAV6K138_9ERIC|nr:hypothetical protein RHGRI_018298 [Rhododendron griersonianum]
MFSSSIPSSPHPHLTSTPWTSPPPPPPTRTASGSPSNDPEPKPRKRSKPSLDENKEPRFDENKAQIFRLKLTGPPPTQYLLLVHPESLKLSKICRYKERRWDLKQFIGSGGMPSSHLATVTSFATAVGFHDDFGGSPFATALVMYDAFGVRLHAGRQVEVIVGSFLGLVTVIVGHFIVASGRAEKERLNYGFLHPAASSSHPNFCCSAQFHPAYYIVWLWIVLYNGRAQAISLPDHPMLRESVTPNKFTFPSVIRACCVDYAVEEGKQVHAHVLKFGFGSDGVIQNNLIHMYMNFQYLEEARQVFDWMPYRDIVSWTTLISGYSQWGCVDETFEVFELMSERNSVSWNAMIAANVRGNRFQEAFALFDRMRSEKAVLDKYVAANKAFEVFNGLARKGISSWNSMIGGLALHGKGMVAIELLKEMERQAMVAPDFITFVNVLGACAHSGLVEEGHHYFRYMTEVHGIEPGSEHFGCMVDILGRAGLLEEARDLINKMPMIPDASVLGALLGACRIHGEIELGEQIGQKVIELEPHNSGRYVLLANIYADAGRWEDVATVRKLMNDRGVKKAPGFSRIELEGRCLKILQIPMSEVTDTMVEKHAESLTDISVLDIGYSLEITSKGLQSFAKQYESTNSLVKEDAPKWERPAPVASVTDATWQSLVFESVSPVLVEFWAPWCGPCRMIHPVIDELAKQYTGKLKCYKVNTDESPSNAT